MKIGIVGLGLIGGSLALDFKAAGHWVLGIARRGATCEQAIAHQIVDQAVTDLKSAAIADVIFICTPIAAIGATLDQLRPYLRPTTVVSDVGSVKGALVAAATERWPNFVGGHPMAGKAEAGLDVAEAGLFRDRPYVLTPVSQTPPEAVTQLKHLITEALHARIYECDPSDHDRAVAWISHLPVMVSSGLIQACLEEPDPAVLTLAQAIASSGFCDTSRVGGGAPELGLMMAQFNRLELRRSLYAYRQQVDILLQIIDQEDWSALGNYLKASQAARPQFLQP